jgi:hypothetical protein
MGQQGQYRVRKFEELRNRHRGDDGALVRPRSGASNGWNGKRILGVEACVRKVRGPGFSKVVAISQAMGVPREAWFEEDERGCDE